MFQRQILYASLLLFVVFCDGLLGWTVLRDRDRAWQRGVAGTEGAAQLLAAHAARALEASDALLKHVADLVEDWDLADRQLGRKVWLRTKQRVEESPHISSLWIIDANGGALLENWSYPMTPANYSSRAYFRAHAGPEAGLVVGEAQRGTVTNRMRFTVSRAVRHPDGRLKAVLVAGIFSDYFSDAFQETGLGDDVAMVLVNQSGELLAAAPSPEAGKDLLGLAEGVGLTVRLSRDGARWLVTRQTVPGFPAKLLVAVPVARLMDGWRGQTSAILAFAVPANIGLLVLVVMGLRGLRRERAYHRQLEAHNRELERGVRDRTARLDAALERERTANRAKDLFLATVSHDLRQPLQAMSLLAGVISGTAADENARRLADQVADSLTYGQRLLGDLVDLAQLEAGVAKIELSDVPVLEVLEAVLAAAQDQAAGKGIALSLRGRPGIGITDPDRLRQIVQNLVSNALKNTPAGGRVSVTCRTVGEMLRVAVWDTGPGIPPDKLEVIFEQFYQLGNDERNSANGVGLGLAIVRRTAELLGHRIVVRSRVGKGSMFAVMLPRAIVGAPVRELELA